MILRNIQPMHFGPFSSITSLEIEPDVTVLTGPNDTGKSCLLRLIDLICSGKHATEDDINTDRVQQADSPWEADPEFGCIVTFTTTSITKKYLDSSDMREGDELVTHFTLAPNQRKVTITAHTRLDESIEGVNKIVKMPNVLYLPLKDEIRTTISLESPNELEKKLLVMAFGKNFFVRLSSLNRVSVRRVVSGGSKRLNVELKKLLPPSMSLEFDLDIISDNPLQIAIHLEDKQQGYTPLHARGAGVRKIITLMVALLGTDLDSEHVYILFDEPENSLHADAQHTLRALLEELASRETVQVIYATHSPSMINTMKREGLRLLKRVNERGKATSVIINRPITENFQPVRSSLGLSPADSLLYAPITVIVEGATEIVSLPFLLQRLYKEDSEGFELVDRLLAQSHFLDGQGDSYEYMCRLVKSQGAKPIIFVDGDKIRRVNQQRVQENHPDVPIITLKEGQEFEEIVPKAVYFRALANVIGENISPENFDVWEKTADLPEQMMFTKRVERWLQAEFPEAHLDKPKVMRNALELADLQKIDLEPVLRLVNRMRDLLA